MAVEPKIGGKNTPQNGWLKINGKPYEQMDDLGGKNHPYFWVDTHIGAYTTQLYRGLNKPL